MNSLLCTGSIWTDVACSNKKLYSTHLFSSNFLYEYLLLLRFTITTNTLLRQHILKKGGAMDKFTSLGSEGFKVNIKKTIIHSVIIYNIDTCMLCVHSIVPIIQTPIIRKAGLYERVIFIPKLEICTIYFSRFSEHLICLNWKPLSQTVPIMELYLMDICNGIVQYIYSFIHEIMILKY